MDMQLSDEQKAIDESVRRICAGFDDQYWTDCEENSRFPAEYYQAMDRAVGSASPCPKKSAGPGLASSMRPS